MSTPRVLHVLEAIETGCARHLTDVVTSATTVEHHVAVPDERTGGHTDHRALRTMAAAGATIHRVPMRRAVASGGNALAVVTVARLARRIDADVLHGHSSIGGVVARTAAAGTRAATAYTPNGLAEGRLAHTVERALGRRTDRLVAVSATEAEEVRRRRLVPTVRVVVIPNGIDPTPPGAPEGPSLRARLGVPEGVPLIGSLGRLVPQKAPEVLVAAWARIAADHPDARFVLIGDGGAAAARAVDEALAAAPLAGRATRLPFLEEAARHLGDLDVFVLASRFEGGPYAPLEAMRAGVPVVLTDVVGSRDTVEPGRTGLLAPADDPDAIARSVSDLLGDPVGRSRMAAAGAASVAIRFSVAGMGRAYDALYADLADLEPRPDRNADHP